MKTKNLLSLALRCSTHALSNSKSCTQSRAAAPKPTQRAGARVPLLSPRSWPPPEKMGSRRTRGFRLTYKAPIPLGP